MKCADCGERHKGLSGLAPIPKDAPPGPKYARTYYDWLCKPCQEKRRLPKPEKAYTETDSDWL